MYYAILDPFHRVVSATSPLSYGRDIINKTQSRLTTIIEAEKPVKALYRITSNLPEPSSLTTQLNEEVKKLFTDASDEDKSKATLRLQQMTSEMLAKIKSDTEDILKQNINESNVIPLTNRRAEASFATFKAIERKYISMQKYHTINVSLAKINNARDYLSEMVSLRSGYYLY